MNIELLNTLDNISSTNHYICLYNFSDVDQYVPTESNILNVWFSEKQQYEIANKIYNFIQKNIHNINTIYIYSNLDRKYSYSIKIFIEEIINEKSQSDCDSIFLSWLRNAKFKFIRKVNYKVDIDTIRQYYFILENKYQHLKWDLSLSNEVVDTEKHKLDGFYGWGIQSNLEDLTKPCPPYDVHHHGLKDYRNTELVFGFVTDILKTFPYARQIGMAVHPQEVEIAQHIDNDEYVKIHIPIFSTDKSFFMFEDNKFVLTEGNAWLVDTRYKHGTSQKGLGKRVHLLFKIPISKTSCISCI